MVLVIDRGWVEIEIPKPETRELVPSLELRYREKTYTLVRVYAKERVDKFKQFVTTIDPIYHDRYIIIEESKFHSLWQITDLDLERERQEQERESTKYLLQANCWFLREIWQQLAEAIGNKQMQEWRERLLKVVPQISSIQELEKLATEPIALVNPEPWTLRDAIAFSHQLDRSIKTKFDRQFAQEVVAEIIADMPARLQLEINRALNEVST
jgi:hypothetical protein